MLPRDAVSRVGVQPQAEERYELVGFEGTRAFAEAADLDVLICGKAFRGRYLLTDAASGILGWDVLAALKLLFDGPMQEWSEGL